MPAKPKVRIRDTVNPFAHIEAAKKQEEDRKKAAEAKKRADAKEEVRTKSWMDAPFDAMLHVGNYLRGIDGGKKR